MTASGFHRPAAAIHLQPHHFRRDHSEQARRLEPARLGDLVAFASDVYQPSLPSALLVRLAWQDALLYDLVRRLVVPRWRSGERTLTRADVQRLLDEAELEHPEIGGWTHATRQKAAGRLNRINAQEFPLTSFSYRDRETGETELVATKV